MKNILDKPHPKEQGIVKHIGLSSHTPSVIQRIMNDVPIDMLMFSVNPAYDFGHGEYANGGVDERAEIYKRCERDGVGISVMKPFSGGQLLDAKVSPFGKPLSIYQCIRYALDKPGVLTVLPGAQSTDEVERLLDYYNKADEELDYSAIGSFAETARVGLGVPFERRHKVLGIEDSSAGVVSIKLAGFSCCGVSGGNIDKSGISELCDYRVDNLLDILNIIL